MSEKKKEKIALQLVVDVSGSMGGDRLENVKDALKKFVMQRALNRYDYVGLIAFNTVAEEKMPLTTATKKDVQQLFDIVDSLDADGSTAVWDAIGVGLDKLAAYAGNRTPILVALTDGEDNSSKKFPNCPAVEKYARHLGVNNLKIYVVGIGLQDGCLKHLSTVFGGTYTDVGEAGDVSGAFDDISDDIGEFTGRPASRSTTSRLPQTNKKRSAKKIDCEALEYYLEKLRKDGHDAGAFIYDYSEDMLIKVVKGLPDDKELSRILAKLAKTKDCLKKKIVFMGVGRDELPEWVKGFCEEYGIEIDSIDAESLREEGIEIGPNGSWLKKENRVPGVPGAPCYDTLRVVPEEKPIAEKTAQPTLQFDKSDCYDTEAFGAHARVEDIICFNLCIATEHIQRCRKKGKNSTIIVESTDLLNIIAESTRVRYCWERFLKAAIALGATVTIVKRGKNEDPHTMSLKDAMQGKKIKDIENITTFRL